MTAFLRSRRGTLGVRPPWTPFLFGTALRGWFDSRAPATVTQAAGLVSAWASRVNSWSVIQPVGFQQPAVSPIVAWGSRQVLVFDNTDQLVRDTPPEIFRNTGAGTIAVSHNFTNATGADAASVFVSTGAYNSQTRAALGINSAGLWSYWARRLDGDGLATRAWGTASTSPVLQVGRYNWAAGTVENVVNSALIDSGSLTSAGVTSDTTELRVTLGVTPLAWAGGRISNVLLHKALWSTDERRKWEGYEAHSLGMASTLLPSTHPFRFAPPRAALDEMEAFADTLHDIDFTFPADRERAVALYVPIRGLVPGWRAAA